METLENSERHWPARRKHMFFQIFMAQHICRDAVEIHWANGNIQVIRPVRGSVLMVKRRAEYVPPYWVLDSTSVLQKHNQSLDKYAFLRNSAFTHWVKEKCSKYVKLSAFMTRYMVK